MKTSEDINALRDAIAASNDLLIRLLPFMEDIEGDAAYKPGAVSKLVSELKRIVKSKP